MMPTTEVASSTPNPLLAIRMGVIAFITQNVAIACIYGSFSVLLLPVGARLGVTPDLVTLAVPLANLTTAICAPLVGVLATRWSLRWVMVSGSVLSCLGFLLLATTHSYPLYLLAYALLLGPGMAVGAVLPSTLVTRWFTQHRGRALGIVMMPIVIALVPLAATWILSQHGVGGTYLFLAALSVVPLLANLFVVDWPPKTARVPEDTAAISAPRAPASLPGVWRSPTFFALALGYIASTAASIIITANMVPMAATWSISGTLAATLLTVQSLAGIGGTLLFGWVADRIGGTRTLALVVFDSAVLWLLLLLDLPFAGRAVLIAAIGLHGAGVLPAIGVALSERFGRERFASIYGLVNLVALPFSFVAVPAAAFVYTRTRSYNGAIISEAAFLLLAGMAVLAAQRDVRCFVGPNGSQPAS